MVEENKNEGPVFKLGDEEVEVDKVQSILDDYGKVKQNFDSVKGVHSFAEQYNLTPDELLQQAQGAFNVVANLVDQGIIDADGKVIGKESGEQSTPPSPPSVPETKTPQSSAVSEEAIAKLVEKAMAPYAQAIESHGADLNRFASFALQRTLKDRYPDITNDQMAQAVARTKQFQNKTVLQHAEDILGETVSYKEQVKQELAKELGIDLNELKEQSGDAEAGAIIENKKVSFKKKGEDVVSPFEATKRFFGRALPK